MNHSDNLWTDSKAIANSLNIMPPNDITTPPKLLRFSQNTVLYRQQEIHPWVYRVQAGYVVLSGTSLEGKDGLTELYGSSSWFGPGLADHEAYQTARAKPGTVLERWEAEEFAHYATQHPDTALTLIHQLSHREQLLQQRLLLQQTAPLPARLAQLLLHYFMEQGQPCRHGHDVDIHLSQQELASMVGGSRQSVSQLLAQWKRAGVIDYTRAYICLEDQSKLQDYF